MNNKLKQTLISSALLSTLALVGCNSTQNSNNITSIQAFEQQLQQSDRPEKDKLRDAGRKPAQVVDFFGIEPGMTVLEVLSSGGYYTEILSEKVGSNGQVIAQNNRFILDVFNGRFAKEFEQRFDNNRLNNVDHYVKEFTEFDLNNQVDVITIILNYHDMYSNFSQTKRAKVLAQMKQALKPGGTVGVIDIESKHGNQKALHRISADLVIKDFTEAGFVLDSEAEFLKNPADDYSKMVFDPSVRGKTDRFVLRFKAQ